MLDNNKNQILKFEDFNATLAPVTDAVDRAKHIRDIYDQPILNDPIPAKWSEISPNRTWTRLDRKMVRSKHQWELTKLIASDSMTPQWAKWFPCRNWYSAKRVAHV